MYNKDAQGKDEANIADTVGLYISSRSKVRKINVTTITDRQQTNARQREEDTDHRQPISPMIQTMQPAISSSERRN